ncbi:MAG: hemolysin family protein [Acholeplasmataceae bacterium]|nr:hemolysin family protein [Acholeplasmataceae bacterium]
MIISVIAIILIITFTAIMSASEVALVVVSDAKVNEDVLNRNKKALKIQKFTDQSKRYLLSIQVIVTLLALVNGAVALDAFYNDVMALFNNLDWLKPIAMFLITFVLLFVHIVFGRLIPRRLAIKYTDVVAYQTIGLITVIHSFLKPITYLLNKTSVLFGRFVGLKPDEGERRMTEEEIRSIVEVSSRSGNIDEDESEMIQNIFDFSDTIVEEIMTHRTEISSINMRSTRKQIISFVQNERFTRFPVYDKDIDHIIGTIHVKDLLKFLDNDEEKFSLKSLLREPYFVPDSKKTSELFKEMQEQKNHIAIVLDEYGGTAGIVTIEDLIEEIVGNIFDEYDEDEEEIKTINSSTYEIDGLTNIDDVEDEINAGLPVDDYDTIGGFILGQLGRFPNVDEKVVVKYNSFTFEVLETNDNVITKIRVNTPDHLEDQEEDEEL